MKRGQTVKEDLLSLIFLYFKKKWVYSLKESAKKLPFVLFFDLKIFLGGDLREQLDVILWCEQKVRREAAMCCPDESETTHASHLLYV